MKIRLKKFNVHWNETGHVAFFDCQLECGIDLIGLSLLRPDQKPDVGWLVIPMLEREGRPSVYLSSKIRKLIGERACVAYQSMTGTALKFQLPPSMQTPPHAVCASVEDALSMAGISA